MADLSVEFVYVEEMVTRVLFITSCLVVSIEVSCPVGKVALADVLFSRGVQDFAAL